MRPSSKGLVRDGEEVLPPHRTCRWTGRWEHRSEGFGRLRNSVVLNKRYLPWAQEAGLKAAQVLVTPVRGKQRGQQQDIQSYPQESLILILLFVIHLLTLMGK